MKSLFGKGERNNEISKSNKIKEPDSTKLINGLTSLFFCKDYSNHFVQKKGKLSDKINQFYQDNESIHNICCFI